MIFLALLMSSVALVIGTVAIVYSIKLNIIVEARERSTHSIQYVPLDKTTPMDANGFEVLSEETKKRMVDEDLI